MSRASLFVCSYVRQGPEGRHIVSSVRKGREQAPPETLFFCFEGRRPGTHPGWYHHGQNFQKGVHMPAFRNVRLHLIWSTHRREPFIQSSWQEALWAYLHGIGENIGVPVINVGGAADHVHLYVAMNATKSVADIVNAFKANSSRWVHENHDPAFAWQTKYAAFSVSRSAEATLLAYIANQQEHHRHKSFAEELREFLERHGVAYDPMYLLE